MVTMVQPVKMEICVHQIRARTEEHVTMAMVGITVLVAKAGQDLTANRKLETLTNHWPETNNIKQQLNLLKWFCFS